MAQGQIKKPKAGAPKVCVMSNTSMNSKSETDTITPSTQRKQTGSRVIKPKKTSLIKKEQMKKVFEAFRILKFCPNQPLS
jgi:hypothetical protein